MKIFKILLASSLLLGTSAIAFTTKVKEPLLVKGTSIGEYNKPGAPVEIRYTSEHVDVGEVSKVDIMLISSVITGTMKVKIKLDKQLNEISNVDKHLSFDLDSKSKEYPIDLDVSADEDGLYYIKLHVAIKGKGMRAFAIPVYFGEGQLKTQKAAVEKTQKGENISVSAAEETITKE